MKVNFVYNRDRDVWCVLNKGKNSNNSQKSTKQYDQLVAAFGENPTEEEVSVFIDRYVAESDLDVTSQVDKFQADWEKVSEEFHKRAQSLFGTVLPEVVTAYVTINSRCPYSIKGNYFYVSMSSSRVRAIVMHELWHFYTWYGLGPEEEVKLGKQKYNNLKESLTVLLNVECGDLFPEGGNDVGYPQHQELRRAILEYWEKEKNLSNLWRHLVTLVNNS